MSVLVVIQARLGSARLPRKVLEQIGPLPALAHTLARARDALPLATHVIATPAWDGPAIADVCTGELFLWDGPENDVLGRFHALLGSHPEASAVVRLTADCPFVDPEGIRAVADAVGHRRFDYAWTGDRVNGLDAEAFTPALLRSADRGTALQHDREHVTTWMRRTARRIYRHSAYAWLPPYRWTLDTPEDLAFFRAVAELTDVTPPRPTPWKLHLLLAHHPQLARYEHAGAA